ncbi:DR2241 family protein [Verrucomicrobium sp. 3C]|uniref:DR2241 family protein n=1 Tax=Verrucomicrobium sp. 3C TaxID=1134055 RepID=UPI0003681FE0|nr:DR2241 family protein [Verrucomicrobium sp. 3C]
MKLTQWLEARLARTSPPWTVGEVRIYPGYLLTHWEDAPEDSRLRQLSGWEAFLDLVRFDAAGRFRPLRGAPGLRKGWRRGPLSIADLFTDLRVLYPGAMAILAAWETERLGPTPFSMTARRQTGIYEVTRQLPDEDLPALVEQICVRGCLRHPLWHLPAPQPDKQEGLTLLCPEACHYFLHRARARAAA